MNVVRPRVPGEAGSHSYRLAASLGDTLVEQGRDLSDGLPVQPSVLLEKGNRAVSKHHGCGCEEKGSLIGGELQV